MLQINNVFLGHFKYGRWKGTIAEENWPNAEKGTACWMKIRIFSFLFFSALPHIVCWSARHSFQVENVRNYDKMLQAARSLRVEREKEQSLARQKLEQKNQVKIKHYPYYRGFFVRYSFWFLYVFVIFIYICKFLVCIISY